MNPKPRTLSLIDMDIGLFLSDELTAEALSAKRFRPISRNLLPLNRVKDFRQACTSDITKPKGFNCRRKKWALPPFYTHQTDEKQPRVFMRLDDGFHYEMKQWLGELNDG